MARIVFAPGIEQDWERIFGFLFERSPETAADRVAQIVQALDVLAISPMIGRPKARGQRELVVSAGTGGYLALYRYQPEADMVRVLAVRSQRERAYRRRNIP